MLERSRLIQPFRDPSKSGALASLAFGCRGLSFSEDGWEAVNQIGVPVYMGAYEYEMGALPKALGHIVQNSATYVRGFFTLKKRQIKSNWCRNKKSPPKKTQIGGVLLRLARSSERYTRHEIEREVYFLCPKELEEAVKGRVIELALEKCDIKNGCDFSLALDPFSESQERSKGWIDLGHHFMFFVDEGMFERACSLLGVITYRCEDCGHEGLSKVISINGIQGPVCTACESENIFECGTPKAEAEWQIAKEEQERAKRREAQLRAEDYE